MNTAKLILIFMMTIKCFDVSSQTSEQSTIAVYYDYKHIVDTTQPENPSSLETVLCIGKVSSTFTSLKQIKDQMRLEEFQKRNPEARLFGRTVFFGAPISFLKMVKGDAKVFSLSILDGNNFVVEEKLDIPQWKITSETKMIANYLCQKAITNFKGRVYEAWFCNQLPYQNGPWKLGGLPGLILEAYDLKKEIIFTFKSIEDTSTSLITLPVNHKFVTSKELNRAIQAFQDQISLPSDNSTIRVTQSVSGEGVTKRKLLFNNPIEKGN